MQVLLLYLTVERPFLATPFIPVPVKLPLFKSLFPLLSFSLFSFLSFTPFTVFTHIVYNSCLCFYYGFIFFVPRASLCVGINPLPLLHICTDSSSLMLYCTAILRRVKLCICLYNENNQERETERERNIHASIYTYLEH